MALSLMTDPQFSLNYWSPVLLLPVSKGSIQNSSLDCSGLVVEPGWHSVHIVSTEDPDWTFPFFLSFPSIHWRLTLVWVNQAMSDFAF